MAMHVHQQVSKSSKENLKCITCDSLCIHVYRSYAASRRQTMIDKSYFQPTKTNQTRKYYPLVRTQCKCCVVYYVIIFSRGVLLDIYSKSWFSERPFSFQSYLTARTHRLPPLHEIYRLLSGLSPNNTSKYSLHFCKYFTILYYSLLLFFTFYLTLYSILCSILLSKFSLLCSILCYILYYVLCSFLFSCVVLAAEPVWRQVKKEEKLWRIHLQGSEKKYFPPPPRTKFDRLWY